MKPNYAALLARFPGEFPTGPCCCCGGPYAAHRVIDAWRNRHAAGETIEDIIVDLPHESPELIRAVLDDQYLTQWEFVDAVMTAWEEKRITTDEINETIRDIRRSKK